MRSDFSFVTFSLNNSSGHGTTIDNSTIYTINNKRTSIDPQAEFTT